MVTWTEQKHLRSSVSRLTSHGHPTNPGPAEVIQRHSRSSRHIQAVDAAREHRHLQLIGGEFYAIVGYTSAFITHQQRKIMPRLVSVNLRRPGQVVEGDDAWMEPGDLIDFDGWECFADSGAIYHRLHEALRVTESTIRSKHRSGVLHHQSVGRVFYAVADQCN